MSLHSIAGALKTFSTVPPKPADATATIERAAPQGLAPSPKAAGNTQALADSLGIDSAQLLTQLQNGNLSKLLSSGYTQATPASTGGLLTDVYA